MVMRTASKSTIAIISISIIRNGEYPYIPAKKPIPTEITPPINAPRLYEMPDNVALMPSTLLFLLL